ncbi:MAG TPA: 2-dehydropantoate 2-reductase [Burkholderiales bacterium]|nr:2-dehydropantoate 2-reductase [Burkholderiales bacterium]
MRIVTMGAGGVNGYFGARLQQAGHEVVFIARGRHLAALQSEGLRIRSPLGDAHLKVKAVENAAQAGEADVIFFAVKLWDTEAAARQLASLKAPVIPFQNGVEAIERLGAILGPERVLGGSAYIASRIESPGVIEHVGTMARLQFGAVRPSQRAIAEELLAASKQAGINAEISPDIVRVNWEKFVFLVGLSSATAVSRAPLGVVRSDPDLRWLFEEAMRETWRVGRARGVALPDDFVESRMQFAETLPAEMRASMLHDLQAGGRLEAPWLCGAVVRMSREAGLDAPVNRSVFAALKPFVDGSARQAS